MIVIEKSAVTDAFSGGASHGENDDFSSGRVYADRDMRIHAKRAHELRVLKYLLHLYRECF